MYFMQCVYLPTTKLYNVGDVYLHVYIQYRTLTRCNVIPVAALLPLDIGFVLNQFWPS